MNSQVAKAPLEVEVTDLKLEVIGFNIEDCMTAQHCGANRIELCGGPGEGGTTPSYGFIKSARQKLDIELYVMIRPRGGDFLYSMDEFKIMIADVQFCKKLGCDGIVIGLLNEDGSIDKQRCSALVELAYPLGITFHRAFDRTLDPYRSMEEIIECGCERILTSGQRPNALEGIELIASLVEKGTDRIIIMPGSGIRSDNIAQIAAKTKATEFHTSAGMLTDSKMNFINNEMREELRSVTVNSDEIKKMKTILSGINN